MGVRALALIVSVTGLAAGLTLTRLRGLESLFGRVPSVIEAMAAAVVTAPLRLTEWIVNGVAALERSLDAAARAVSRIRIDSQRIERGLDALALGIASLALRAAADVERIERLGLGAGGDRAAGRLQAGGQYARAMQTGKLYLYTVGLFVWVLLVGACQASCRVSHAANLVLS